MLKITRQFEWQFTFTTKISAFRNTLLTKDAVLIQFSNGLKNKKMLRKIIFRSICKSIF